MWQYYYTTKNGKSSRRHKTMHADIHMIVGVEWLNVKLIQSLWRKTFENYKLWQKNLWRNNVVTKYFQKVTSDKTCNLKRLNWGFSFQNVSLFIYTRYVSWIYLHCSLWVTIWKHKTIKENNWFRKNHTNLE